MAWKKCCILFSEFWKENLIVSNKGYQKDVAYHSGEQICLEEVLGTGH